MCQGHPLTHLFLYVYATYAFSECNGITSFTLEDSPNTIQLPNRMFDNLRNLVTFYIGRNYTAEYDWYGYPQGSRDAYKAAVCWKEFFDDYATEFDATGINAITIDGAQNGKVYNLNGQQVDRQTIQKGLYILNGKKVMMK